ncbi:MAG: glycoside hydrolase family protein [Euryarchaeota archaeon]|nr:glycoside hydrolase family protein [Euryarchaeota archaeon]
MTESVLIDQLIHHEGLRLRPYRCPAGRLTIGVGRNLDDKGISHEEALYLLKNDISESVIDLQDIFDGGLYRLPEIVQRVLIDMRFNLGASGFRRFKKMIAAVNIGNFDLAALEMENSNWYNQVGNRSKTLVKMMLKAS